MDMVQCALWHLVKDLVDLTLHELFLHFEEVMDGDVVDWCDKSVLQLLKLLVGCYFITGLCGSQTIREMHLLVFFHHSCLSSSMLSEST